jgi:AcrR family transcriptional regulator
MGRKPDPQRRAALLAAFADYVLEHGLADLSLRPAAAALDTSPRMLLYHFGSKEELIVEAIAAIRARQTAFFAQQIARSSRSPARPMDILGQMWRWYTLEKNEPYSRLFYEVYGLAIKHPKRFGKFLEIVGTDFRGFMEAGLIDAGLPATKETRALASFYAAAFRGLTIDLLTTGDRRRVNAAIRTLDHHLRRDMARSRPRRHVRRSDRRSASSS